MPSLERDPFRERYGRRATIPVSAVAVSLWDDLPIDADAAISFRPVRERDVDDVVAAYRRAFGDARPIDAGELLSWFRNPEVDADAQTRVLEIGDVVVGYGDVWVAGADVALEVAAPGHWATFLEWAEDTARSHRARRVRVISYARDDLAAAASARGYVLWRSNYTMRIEFQAPPAVSSPPGRIGLQTYREEDAERVRLALNEIFAADPFFAEMSADHFQAFHRDARGFDPALWLLAWDESELAGVVLAFPERAGDTTVGRIESLGVRLPWRGRGVGEYLLRSALQKLHDRGLRSVELGVDASNETGPVRLYERVGMSVLRQADNWALEIRSAPDDRGQPPRPSGGE